VIETDVNFEKLNSYINNLIKKDLCSREIKCCPYCKSERYIRYGTYKKVQRFKCKLCQKTFSFSTGFIWSYSKKKPEKWVEFLELMLENRTLRSCARKLKINLGTAFYWRHKLLHSFIDNNKVESISGDIHLGKGIIKENFKGCRNILSSERNEIWIAALKGDSSINPKSIGIGLSLSKSIIEKQGGEIKLISEEGKGTTFSISFLEL